MPVHSTTANVEWARLHELEAIANATERLSFQLDPRTGSVAKSLERIAVALEKIANKP